MATPRYPTTQYLSGNFVLSAGSVLFRVRKSLVVQSQSQSPSDADVDVADVRGDEPDSDVMSTAASTSTSTSSPPTETETKTVEEEAEEKEKEELSICILHEPTLDIWVLPKGRKDSGESLEDAAVRETYEETGWRCALWACRMRTLATVPGGGGGGGGEGEGAGGEDINSEYVPRLADGLVEPIAIHVREIGSGITKMIFWYITRVEEGAEKVEGSQMAGECFRSVFVGVREAMDRLTFGPDRDVVRLAVEIVRSQY